MTTLSAAAKNYQLGTIVYLAKALDSASPQFGKTALQKLVFLLQESKGVPCGYSFTFYNHGPFSAELAGDLDYLKAVSAVKISFVVSGSGGYVIEPGEDAWGFLEKSETFINRHREQIETVIEDYGSLTARQLELRATVVFIQKDSQRRGQSDDREVLAEKVTKVKPQFSPAEVLAAIDELYRKGYIRDTAKPVSHRTEQAMS